MSRTCNFSIVLVSQENGSFAVQVPALPEVNTQGKDRAQALERAREAIELAIEQRLADGDEVPPDAVAELGIVTIEAAA